MVDREELEASLACAPVAREVDQPSPGLYRISTPFLYPDGSYIDVFVEREPGLAGITQIRVTDLGETFIWLSHLPIDPLQHFRRRAILHEILRVTETTHKDGELCDWVDDVKDIPESLLRVAQAAMRTADLIYTLRQVTASDFHQEFTLFLEGRALAYNERVTVQAPDREVEIAFEVTTRKVTSWAQLISAKSPTAHTIANEITLRWMDLAGVRPEVQRVTVVDDDGTGLRPYDLAHLEKFSRIASWSDQASVAEALAL